MHHKDPRRLARFAFVSKLLKQGVTPQEVVNQTAAEFKISKQLVWIYVRRITRR